MAHPAPVPVGPEVRSSGLGRSGFTTLLWDVLRGLGYTEAPVYQGQRFREADFGTSPYDVRAVVPAHPYHEDWPLWTYHAVAADFEDAMEQAAYDTLCAACNYHREALIGTPAALFPRALRDTVDYYACMAHAIQNARGGWPSHLGALMDYAIHLGQLHHRREVEHRALWRTVAAVHRQDAAAASHSEAAHQQQLQSKDQQIAAKDEQILALQQQLAGKDHQVHNLEQELQETKVHLSDAMDNLADLEAQVGDLEMDVLGLQDGMAELQELQEQMMAQQEPPEPEEDAEEVQGDSGIDSEDVPPEGWEEMDSDADSAPVPPQ